MMWISLLHGRVKASLAASRGVHGAADVIKYILCGADAVMTTSSLITEGIDHIGTMLRGLTEWMKSHRFDNIPAWQGRLSHSQQEDQAQLARQQYLQVMQSAREHVYEQLEPFQPQPIGEEK